MGVERLDMLISLIADEVFLAGRPFTVGNLSEIREAIAGLTDGEG